jgi:hypothetical protein
MTKEGVKDDVKEEINEDVKMKANDEPDKSS